MSVPKKRLIAVVCGDGHIRLVKQDVPELKPGMILIRVRSSLVSPGTEIGGWRALKELKDDPDNGKDARQFGYSNAGDLLAVGPAVKRFKEGDRVACIGHGYALHSNYAVVPQNLCVALPVGVSYAQGSYAMLLATAMHAVRRGGPQLGDYTAVAGLGLVGQLTARIYQLAGSYVIGWDLIPFRTSVAEKWGIDSSVDVRQENEVAQTKEFTRSRGLDQAVLAFGGEASASLDSLVKCMRMSPDGHPTGRIVVVGWPRFGYENSAGGMNNIDICRASRTGPGYHDPSWEQGQEYPDVLVRWTTRSNLELCMRFLSEGKVDVDVLTSHVVEFDRVDEITSELLSDPDTILGMVFEYPDSL